MVPDTIKAKCGDELAATGENYFDGLNKDPSLRNRPIMGLQILTLKPGRSPQFWGGVIDNPEDGNTYSAYMKAIGSDIPRLYGCILFNLIRKGED